MKRSYQKYNIGSVHRTVKFISANADTKKIIIRVSFAYFAGRFWRKKMLKSMINHDLSGKKTNLVLGFMLMMLLAFCTSLMTQNNCLDFDGSNDYVDCGSMNLSGDKITLECWVNVDAFQSSSPYISTLMGTEEVNNIALLRLGDDGLDNNKVQFVLNLEIWGETKLNGNTGLEVDTWYHIAGVFDRSEMKMKIYIDGNLDASSTNNRPIESNSSFNISYSAGGRYLNGTLDEVRIWNDARTESEIRQNMYRELPNPSSETNLVVYYKFNETTGTAADNAEGTATYDGALTNYGSQSGYWQTSSAMYGPKNCLDFDGGLKTGSPDYAYNNQYVTNNVDNFTMMAWLKPDVVTNGPNGWRCVAFNGDDYGGWGIGISDSKVTGLFGGIWWHITAEVLSVGNWYHITMRRSSNTVQFFLNGKLLSYSDPNNLDPDSPSTIFTIGNMLDTDHISIYTDSFDGQIDEVRVYDAALTDQQIRENMCKTLTGIETNLVAYYNFDNTSGTTIQSFDGSTTNDLVMLSMSDDDWVSSSAFNTWLNTSSSSWTTDSNWSRGSDPSSNDNIGIFSYSEGTDLVISGGPSFQVYNMVIGSSTSLTLSTNLTVVYSFILESDLDLNGNDITFSTSSYLIEDAGRITGSSGELKLEEVNLSALTNENLVGLGAEITEDGNLGLCDIVRGVQSQGTLGIDRYYQITTTNSPTNATLVFHYFDSELNGVTESELTLFKSSDGSSWTEQTSATLDTDINTLTLTGINSFSYWTAAEEGSGATLPVTLSSFTAQYIEDIPILCWTTQSETSNAGWNIYRGETNEALSNEEAYLLNLSLGLIPGAGTTSLPTDYSFEDVFPVYAGNTYFYWLESVDYSGESEIYGPISLTIPENEWQNPNSPEIPKPYGLHQNYPNPFNPNTEISFIMKENCICELSIYNVKGQKIKTIFSNESIPRDELIIYNWDGKDESGKEVSTGVYYYKLRTTKADFVRKMILLK